MGETIFNGIGASPGIVIGRAYLLDRRKVVVAEQPRVSDATAKDEVARFKRAIESARLQLDDVRKRVTKDLGKAHRHILDTHIMLLEDKMLVEGTIKRIREEKLRAEAGLAETVAAIGLKFDAMEDEYLRERKHDVEQVAERVLRNLMGRKQESLADIREEAIIIAHDLAPSDTLLMRKEKVLGFATDVGSRTSHTAIVARSLGIPAAAGLEKITASVRTGDVVILDGNHGTVIVDPDEETFLDYLRRKQRYKYFEQELDKLKDLPAETPDGHRIHLQGNIELPEEVATVAKHGGTGIGLYRTEFLFLNRQHLPTEEQHYVAYRDVVERSAPHEVVIRTLDVGGDKVGLPGHGEQEPNPALGLRAIRFCLQNRDIFRTQLRGIFRASAHGKVKILYPMISGLTELQEIKRVMGEVRAELRAEGVPFDERIEIGVMIEIPSAAMTADLLAKEADFFSIGTNDLIQYTLAIDRTNEHVAFMYEPLEPAVLRLLQRVSHAAHEGRIGLAMCGEMAGDPLYAAILMGLGFQYLSMNVAAIPWVKKVVRSVRMQDAVELADLVMRQPTAALARQAAESFMHQRFPDLMAEM
ncbi:MAG: phosphoenolpyruvate--protein phosphotransferase [Nitrospirae bacterium]|nr:phosphoenolpyruvate--protein phosphotransferase [Nitrospirota bacterium]NTW67840.1 phosphoenolpyruvate--protein phosphotransferase [Nitrospirota bacterium]